MQAKMYGEGEFVMSGKHEGLYSVYVSEAREVDVGSLRFIT